MNVIEHTWSNAGLKKKKKEVQCKLKEINSGKKNSHIRQQLQNEITMEKE